MGILKVKDLELRQKAGRLRRILRDLEKEAQEAGFLKSFVEKVDLTCET